MFEEGETHKEIMKGKAENIDSVVIGGGEGRGYRIEAFIYPLDAEVTNPMLKSTRELKVMNEASQGEIAVLQCQSGVHHP